MFDDYMGKHCQEENCNMKDYVSTYCKSCNKDFCKEHAHHFTSCKEYKEVSLPIKQTIKPTTTTGKCNFCNSSILYVKISCKDCHKTFCLKHRLEADHKCRGRETEEVRYANFLENLIKTYSFDNKKKIEENKIDGKLSMKAK